MLTLAGCLAVIIEDEKLGPVFYTIDPPFGDRPAKIVRAIDSCLQCYATSRTSGNVYPVGCAGSE